MKPKLFFLAVFIFLSLITHGQQTSDQFYNKYGLRLYTGNVFAHTDDVRNTSDSRPLSIELEYSRRHISEDVWNLCRCYPTTGFVLGYQDYKNSILGRGGHFSYFVQYHFLQRSKLSPYLRGMGV